MEIDACLLHLNVYVKDDLWNRISTGISIYGIEFLREYRFMELNVYANLNVHIKSEIATLNWSGREIKKINNNFLSEISLFSISPRLGSHKINREDIFTQWLRDLLTRANTHCRETGHYKDTIIEDPYWAFPPTALFTACIQAV